MSPGCRHLEHHQCRAVPRRATRYRQYQAAAAAAAAPHQGEVEVEQELHPPLEHPIHVSLQAQAQGGNPGCEWLTECSESCVAQTLREATVSRAAEAAKEPTSAFFLANPRPPAAPAAPQPAHLQDEGAAGQQAHDGGLRQGQVPPQPLKQAAQAVGLGHRVPEQAVVASQDGRHLRAGVRAGGGSSSSSGRGAGQGGRWRMRGRGEKLRLLMCGQSTSSKAGASSDAPAPPPQVHTVPQQLHPASNPPAPHPTTLHRRRCQRRTCSGGMPTVVNRKAASTRQQSRASGLANSSG